MWPNNSCSHCNPRLWKLQGSRFLIKFTIHIFSIKPTFLYYSCEKRSFRQIWKWKPPARKHTPVQYLHLRTPCISVCTCTYAHTGMHRHLKSFKCIFMYSFMQISLCLYIQPCTWARSREIYTSMQYLAYFPLSLPTVNCLKTDWSNIFCPLAS